MKKLSIVVTVVFFYLIASTAYATDAKRLQKIKTVGQNGNGDLFVGTTVSVADLGKKLVAPVAKVIPTKAKTVPIPAKSVLSSGKVAIAMPMEGEWFRLGSQYSGSKTIYDFVLQTCKRDFTKSVLADNHLTAKQAKSLSVGHKVFIRHIYLKDEYKFGLEIKQRDQGESEKEIKDLRSALQRAGKEAVTLRGELKKTRRLLIKKTEAVSLKDDRVRELEEANSDLEEQIAKKSVEVSKTKALFVQLANKTVDTDNDGNATVAAEMLPDKQDVDALLTQIEDLKKQLAEKASELEEAGQKINTLNKEADHLDRGLEAELKEHVQLENSFGILKAKHEVLSAEHVDLKEMFKQQMEVFSTLGQKIESGFDRLEKERAELKTQLEKLKVELETAQKQLKECREKTPVDPLSDKGTKETS